MLHPYPYTSNPRYRTKERKMEGMNTTLYFWRREKNQETLMCFYVFWERNMVRKERKNAEKDAETAPKMSPLQFELPGAYYRPWHTFLGPSAPSSPCWSLGQARLMSTISSLCTFSILTSDAHFEVFPDSD